MDIHVTNTLADISPEDWNRLCDSHPLLRHEFLYAMEKHGCVGDEFGWQPAYLVISENNQLLGATPTWLKFNNYGEFVFDHAWADAYARHGMNYYPKLVSAIPFTPANTPRLLIAKDSDYMAVAELLAKGSIQLATDNSLSSAHFLFNPEKEIGVLEKYGFMLRTGVQYHWHNHNYRNFDEFLSTFVSKKKKKVRRERRCIEESGLEVRIVTGSMASSEDIQAASHFYRKTFKEKWGTPTFNQAFFGEICQTMGEQVVFTFAMKNNRHVAGTICYRSDDTLYGRHWGCDDIIDNLHFELCYYQGIDYCIREGLQTFEPGAQGEHKIARGFLPTPTYSAHWIAEPAFRDAIAHFLEQENEAMQQHIETLNSRSPYKVSETIVTM